MFKLIRYPSEFADLIFRGHPSGGEINIFHGKRHICHLNSSHSKRIIITPNRINSRLVPLILGSTRRCSSIPSSSSSVAWKNLPKIPLSIGGLIVFGLVINWIRQDDDRIKRSLLMGSSESGGTSTSTSKSKKTFRDRKIIEYENRIRTFSTPDKIFRYFATIKVCYDDSNESEVFMTPDDFLRAVTPGIKQPANLGLEQFRKLELDKETHVDFGLKSDSIFYKLSSYGLINYSDFLFLLTLLSVSQRQFKIAFRVFDLNGDGNVDYEEFEKVQNAILHQTSVGQKLGSAIKTNYRGVSSALARYFFGTELNEKLTTEKFLDFQKQLQEEMLTLEFERKRPNEFGKISESKFAELLITYAGFQEKKKAKVLKRIKKAYPDVEMNNAGRGITLTDYLTFHLFLQNINDVDIALTFYNIAGASIDEATFKHAARTVANVNLRDHLIKVVFVLFDENQDGQLSNKEFVAVMKERLRRGLGRPKDTGLFKLVGHVWNALKMDLF
ncbi:calcium uptake protein 1 homolog, mitochondrial-like isoform X2 [Brevipalpus obovatus]|uniref:calcium uptake protein 1 homolog, mitochondrial-like isoform X2 n=1 Tax=Brevipalpus obovatus TaxID=246614 RepID=UPI003D9E24DA